MRLKSEPIKKRTEESAGQEAEAALEVRDKDYTLPGLYLGFVLIAGETKYELVRDATGPT